MTREELIEKVARTLCWKAGMNPDLTLGGDGQNFLWMEQAEDARAAIDIVLEEAAKIAEQYSCEDTSSYIGPDDPFRIAEEIRALKGE